MLSNLPSKRSRGFVGVSTNLRVLIRETSVEDTYLRLLSPTKLSLNCLDLCINLGQTCKTVLMKDLFINLVFS